MENGESASTRYAAPEVTVIEEQSRTASPLPRIPAGFMVALVGFVLPTVSFTSCSTRVAEVSGLQLATGTGSGIADLPVDVAAIVLGVLTIAGGVAWWLRRRAVESALIALAGIAVFEIALPISVGNALPEGSEVGVGAAGGGFLMAIGFWSAFVIASIYALAPRVPRSYVALNVLIAAGLLVVAGSAVNADPDPFFGSLWSIAALLVVPAAILDLITLGVIRLTRAWRTSRSARIGGRATS